MGVSLSSVSHRIRLAHLPKHSRKSQQQPQPRPAHLRNLFQNVSDMAKYYLLSTPVLPLPTHMCGGDKAVRQAGRKRQRVCHLHTDATKGNKIAKQRRQATRAASSGGIFSVAYFQATPRNAQEQVIDVEQVSR